jgi:hypothetical protein
MQMVLPRSDFVQTMTDSEKKHHEGSRGLPSELVEVGSIVCHGPVDDSKRGGLSIFSANDQTEVERLTAADPIILMMSVRGVKFLPMKQLRMGGAN